MSVSRRPDGKYRARYRDASGAEHSRHFSRKADADQWATLQKASVHTGLHVDPKAARIRVTDYALTWKSGQVHRETTQAVTESQLRLHILPQIGDRYLASLRRSDVQTWIKGRSQVLQPATVRQVYRLLATILKAAVDDRILASSPCSRISLPKIDHVLLVPLSVAEVEALTEAVPDAYRALLIMAAGTGIRPGEAFGVTGDRVNFLRRELRVDRQVITVTGPPRFGPPKTAASVRTVPLPQVVVEALAAHIQSYPPGENGVLFSAPTGGLIRRNHFNQGVWRPTVHRAGLPVSTRFHDLRHFYASLLIHHGESVKTVQARLGHASATETLNTYAHLWPDSDDRTRQAIDAAFARDRDGHENCDHHHG